MANEENMNVDIGNQESFEKKKKIAIICVSVAIVFITLIAGLFFAKKNKENSYENNDIGEVVNNNENDNDQETKDEENEENEEGTIINGSDYFFEKKSGIVTANVLLVIVTLILFFLWEKRSEGTGFIKKENWFGFISLISFIVINFLVEFSINFFIISSISHFLSKDKSKKYLNTLKMSLKKRISSFSSLSIVKILLILGYIAIAFFVSVYVRENKKWCNKTTEEKGIGTEEIEKKVPVHNDLNKDEAEQSGDLPSGNNQKPLIEQDNQRADESQIIPPEEHQPQPAEQ